MTAWSGSHSSGFPPEVRRAILRRDPTCPCGAPATEADHVVPVAEGGSHDQANGQGLCSSCHAAKTRDEAARGRQRWRRRAPKARPSAPHPGLT